MKLSVVFSTQAAQFQAATFKGDLVTNMERIAALGYDGVELAIRDPKLVNLDELLRVTETYHLSVPAIGTGQAWGEEGLSFTDPNPQIRRRAIERIKSHIPVASRFNAVIVIGLIRGVVKPGVSQEQAEAWLCEALQECCHTALPEGVKLALEPINRYECSLVNNITQGLDLTKKVDASNFGLLLDTFHMNIEEANIEETIHFCGHRIFHFHVADSNRYYAGAGHINFTSILAALKDSGYNGWVSGEFLPKPDAETAAKRNIEYLKAIIK
ncbi:MAG: 5-keto-L-gluconate epimerase [Anaerolineaceae bacterium]